MCSEPNKRLKKGTKEDIKRVKEVIEDYYIRQGVEFSEGEEDILKVYEKFHKDIDIVLEYYQDKVKYIKRGILNLEYVMEEISGERISPKEYYDNNSWLKVVISYAKFEYRVKTSDTVEKRKKLLKDLFNTYITKRDKKVVYEGDKLLGIQSKGTGVQVSKAMRDRIGERYSTGYKMLNEYSKVEWEKEYSKYLKRLGYTSDDIEDLRIDQNYLEGLFNEIGVLRGKNKYLLYYHYMRFGSLKSLEAYYQMNSGEDIKSEIYQSMIPFLDSVGGVAKSTFLKRYNLEGEDIERTMYYYMIRETGKLIL